jgi:hypothetical protein
MKKGFILTLLITGLAEVGLYYDYQRKHLNEPSPEHFEAIYKLEELVREQSDLSCIGCSKQPYILFISNNLMSNGINGVTEYEIKDGFIFNKAEGYSNMKFKDDNNSIVGLSVNGCCRWRKISESQYNKEITAGIKDPVSARP